MRRRYQALMFRLYECRHILTLIGVILFGYGVMLATYRWSQEGYLFVRPYPSTIPFDVHIDQNGTRLGGWVIHKGRQPHKAVVVFGDRNQAFADWTNGNSKLSECIERTIVVFPYRGFEGNPGKTTEANLRQDARAVAAWAATQYKDVDVLGFGFGAAMALEAAQDKQVKRVWVASPFDRWPSVAMDLMPWMLPQWNSVDTYDSVATAKRTTQPIHALWAHHDQVSKPQHSQALVKAFGREVDTTVIDSDHHQLWTSPAACQWLRSMSY